MKTAEIVRTQGTQAAKRPEGFQVEGDGASIRREGDAVSLEPVKPATLPPGFFDAIALTIRRSQAGARADSPAPTLD
jgi:virulence-associated protein VagC